MTHPTKAIAHTLLRDFVKVSRGSADEGLYTEKDLADTLERTEVMDFYQTIDIDGIQVWVTTAGCWGHSALDCIEMVIDQQACRLYLNQQRRHQASSVGLYL